MDSLRAQLEELRTIHTAAAQASRDAQDAAFQAASEAQQSEQRIKLETERLSTEVAELRARTDLQAPSSNEPPGKDRTPPAEALRPPRASIRNGEKEQALVGLASHGNGSHPSDVSGTSGAPRNRRDAVTAARLSAHAIAATDHARPSPPGELGQARDTSPR